MIPVHERVIVAIGGVVAVLLQLVIAPAMGIGTAIPNLVAVYVLCAAVFRHGLFGAALPFFMGLSLDLLGGQAVGAYAFTLVLIGVITAAVYGALDNDTLFVPLACLCGGLLLVELVYGIIMMALGDAGGFGASLIYRILPSAIYDCVIGLVLFIPLQRLLTPRTLEQPTLHDLV